MESVLIVDDDRLMRTGLRTLLAGEGFEVRTARNGKEALACVAEARPDLVLLDVMMPGMNGFAVCEELRRNDPRLPVLILSAKDAEVDHVRGLSLGADDYLDKTTGDAEIVARVRRALERARAWKRETPTPIAVGRASVDRTTGVVTEGGAEVARLTATEAALLRALDARRGETVTPEDIVGAVRGAGYRVEPGTVRSQLSRLKEKLGPSGAAIRTDWGAGYRLLR